MRAGVQAVLPASAVVILERHVLAMENNWAPWFGKDDNSQFGKEGGMADIGGQGFSGQVIMWPSPVPPTGWLICDGSTFAREDYPNLTSVLHRFVGTCTFDIATDLVSIVGHGLLDHDLVYFETDGTLPTGLAGNMYEITDATADTFKLSATFAGPPENLAGSPSGIHGLYHAPYNILGSATAGLR